MVSKISTVLLVVHFTTCLLGWANADSEDLQDLYDLEDRLTAKINVAENSLDDKIAKLKEALVTRLDNVEAKLETLISRANNIGSNPIGSPSLPFKRTDRNKELQRQYAEIKSKITNLTLIANSNQGNRVTQEDLNEIRNSVQHELRLYRTQLDDIVRQLRSDNTAESELLSQQVQALKHTVKKMEEQDRKKNRVEVLGNFRNAFSSGNVTFARKCVNDLDDDLTQAMPEIIQSIYKNNLTKYNTALDFLVSLSAKQRLAGIRDLAAAMKQSSQVDSEEYIKLAQSAHREFGEELQNIFPPTLQAAIWSKDVTLQGRDSTGYLMVKDANRAVLWRQEIIVRKLSALGSWKFHHVRNLNSYFITFQYNDGRKERNWNLDASNNQIYASETTKSLLNLGLASKFKWQISTQRNGLSVVIKSVKAPHVYMCSPTSVVSAGEVTLNKSFSSNCEWLVNTLDAN